MGYFPTVRTARHYQRAAPADLLFRAKGNKSICVKEEGGGFARVSAHTTRKRGGNPARVNRSRKCKELITNKKLLSLPYSSFYLF